jgi:hypothetical protein
MRGLARDDQRYAAPREPDAQPAAAALRKVGSRG